MKFYQRLQAKWLSKQKNDNDNLWDDAILDRTVE